MYIYGSRHILQHDLMVKHQHHLLHDMMFALVCFGIALLCRMLQPWVDPRYVQFSDDTFTANLFRERMMVSQGRANRMAARQNRLKR